MVYYMLGGGNIPGELKHDGLRAECTGQLVWRYNVPRADFATPAVDHAALASTEISVVAICGESRSRAGPPRFAAQFSLRRAARASANEGVRLLVYQGRLGQVGVLGVDSEVPVPDGRGEPAGQSDHPLRPVPDPRTRATFWSFA